MKRLLFILLVILFIPFSYSQEKGKKKVKGINIEKCSKHSTKECKKDCKELKKKDKKK